MTPHALLEGAGEAADSSSLLNYSLSLKGYGDCAQILNNLKEICVCPELGLRWTKWIIWWK